MMLMIRRACVLGLALVVSQGVLANDLRVIGWEDLLPETSSELSQSATRASGDWFLHDESSEEVPTLPSYSVGVVEELNGARVVLPGFIVPLELAGDGRVTEFLLVPYYGACIHYPPPPSNQIVHVTLPKPVEIGSILVPVWVAGEIRTEMQQSDLGNASYTMLAEHMEDYE